MYIRSAQINEAGDHAKAVCVTSKGPGRCTITYPEWHNFDNYWWQIDDWRRTTQVNSQAGPD